MLLINPAWERDFNDLAGRPQPPHRIGETLEEPYRTELREETLERLKLWTGQDFGYDEEAWRNWMMANPDWEEDIVTRVKNARTDAT